MTQSASNAKPSSVQGGTGVFAPLAGTTFAVLWLATIFGNVGSFMRDVANAWLVTDLSTSPAAVATIQAAATLPVFLLAFPAGVLSDILDRRRLLIAIQASLAAVTGLLTWLAWRHELTIGTLIALAFAGGIGAAMMGPTWQSIVPELVPANTLRQAVALNSLGVNIARAIGPAAGGLLLGAFGAAVTYGLDVITYVLVIAALVWWRRPVRAPDPLREHFFGAARAGWRYARAHSDLHIVLARTVVQFGFVSCVWSLLPLVARQLLHGGAGLYGVMLGCVGVGAVLGALVMPRLQTRLGVDGMVTLSALLTAGVMLALAFAPPVAPALMLLVVLGAAWIMALSTFGGVTQAILPNWVRGRALAIYQMAFNGALAGGSLLWGAVAQSVGTPHALIIAAAGLALAALLLRRMALPKGDEDLAPANLWADPTAGVAVTPDRGPVMVLIEYHVPLSNREGFLRAVRRLSAERLRDGAFSWGVMEDPSQPGLVTEWFLVESWAEHLRQHRRVAHADADVQKEVSAFHTGAEPPRVRHLLGLSGGGDSHASSQR